MAGLESRSSRQSTLVDFPAMEQIRVSPISIRMNAWNRCSHDLIALLLLKYLQVRLVCRRADRSIFVTQLGQQKWQAQPGFGEIIEQGVGLAVEHAVALLDGSVADGLRQVTFAGAGWAEKQGVFVTCDESARGEIEDQAAI